ncbi:class I SAM-dependent methyltransferase [Phytoactinopolyspora mesophila]|uniref:Methyltransferase domain-containing protein n=1 Tax=Phytoactinopolyspora mesophila TaxID=2650750 RepID=A0A7K3M321_9ACTN|nr:class I SAM-dependent methyltransferase [Phytoactinopolyspora mesophila]NDL57645.1 methyltransferase domain-containing protein [Phytoactinopolyspora mesophila]
MESLRDRLYDSYVSTHAGSASGPATQLAYRRDLRPHLRRTGSADRLRVLDIGCGQGELVRLLVADGFDARGVDVSTEQVSLARAAGLDRVEHADFHAYLRASAGNWDAVVATDVLEHLNREEVLQTFDGARMALRPGGVLVARVPNAVSPTGGHTMWSDVTHETWFTRRSVAQLAAVAGFASVEVFACTPPAHGLVSAARALLWKPISGMFKLALAVETGALRGHIVTQNLTFVARTTEVTNS